MRPVVDAAVLLENLKEDLSRDSVELGFEMGAQRLAAVHRDHLFVYDVSLGEADEEVCSKRLERDVEGRVAARGHVHHRSLVRAVPGEVIFLVDPDGRPGRREGPNPIRGLRTSVDLALERAGGGTTHHG